MVQQQVSRYMLYSVLLLVLSIVVYQVHEKINHIYYRDCSKNIVMALFLSDSTYCKVMFNIVRILEHQVAIIIINHVKYIIGNL